MADRNDGFYVKGKHGWAWEKDDVRVGELVLLACGDCQDLLFERGTFNASQCLSKLDCGEVGTVIGAHEVRGFGITPSVFFTVAVPSADEPVQNLPQGSFLLHTVRKSE